MKINGLKIGVIVCLLNIAGCMMVSAQEQKQMVAEATALTVVDTNKEIAVTDSSFVCLKKMQSVRGFFVDNLLGESELKSTIAAANSLQGAVYPPGSVVQLIPAEVMIKHNKGWNEATKDWEFFELNVSAQGSKIKVRGTTQVINKFGGNCFECHQKSAPQWDLLCEKDHGCDPLPIPDFMIRWTQQGDPRCD